MSDNFDTLTFLVNVESAAAEKKLREWTNTILEVSKTAKRSFEEIGNVAANLFPDDAKSIKSAVAYLETATRNIQQMRQEADKAAAAFEKIKAAQQFQGAKIQVGNINAEYELERKIAEEKERVTAREIERQKAKDRAKAESLSLLQTEYELERKVAEQKERASGRSVENQKRQDRAKIESIGLYNSEMDRIAALAAQEKVRYSKAITDQQALNERIRLGTASIKDYSQAIQSGMIIKPETFKALDAISALGKKADWIPNVGLVRSAMEQIMQSVNVNSTKAGQILRNTFQNIPVQAIQTAERQINQSMTGIRGIVHNIFSDLKAATQTFFGVTMAMAVFNAAKMISDFFRDTVQKARDAERELRELNLAEALMSKAGIEVTRTDLDEQIEYLQKKYKGLLPEREFRSIVSETAMLARNFGLTREEIFKMADDVTYLVLSARLMGNETVNVGNIVNAMLDKNIRTLNTYGVNVLQQAVYQKALNMELIKEGDELEGTNKLRAIIEKVYEDTAANADELTGSLKGQREELVLLNAVWVDAIKVDVGGWFLDAEFGMLKALETAKQLYEIWDLIFKSREGKPDAEQSNVMAFLSLLNPIKLLHVALIELGAVLAVPIAALTVFFNSLRKGETVWQAFSNAGVAASEVIKNSLLEILLVWIPKVDSELARVMKGTAKWAWGWDIDEIRSTRAAGAVKRSETPTAEVPELEEEQGKLAEALEKMNNAILEAQIKLEQDMESAAIELGRKLVDIDREYLRKREEAYIDFTNKIGDINRSFDEKILDIRKSANDSAQKHRENELKREEDFQNKMLELKEKFLMDLEEALHARDARQVLRLIKQYNLDQEQLTRRHELDKKQAAREEELRQQKYKQEIADAERQRQLKLRQAEIEYRDKLEKLKREEEAEREAAHIAYQREIDDLHRKMHDRLEILAAGLVEEFDLTEDGLDRIKELYLRHYEDVRRIYEAMRKMKAGQSMTLPTSMRSETLGRRPIGMARGGTLIANRPTNVVFGEAGAELATFIPLSKLSSGLSGIMGAMGSSGGSGGEIQIDVNLSPDLEARVVRNTLNQASNIIAKVSREKR